MAGLLPKSTAVAEARPVPIIVTLVPPAGNPVRGETEAITGGPVAAPEGATPTTVNATPKVPRHKASASAPFAKRKNSQPTSSTTPWSLHSSPLAFRPLPPAMSPQANRLHEVAPPPPDTQPIRRVSTVSHHLQRVNTGVAEFLLATAVMNNSPAIHCHGRTARRWIDANLDWHIFVSELRTPRLISARR